MAHNQFQPDGGDRYKIILSIALSIGILFLFGLAVGLGISIGSP